MTFLQKLQERKIDNQVLLIALGVATLRSLFAIAKNLAEPTTPSEWVVDLAIFAGLTIVCILAFQGKVTRLNPFFTLALCVLVTLSFIQFGGVRGSVDFNLLTVGVLVVFLHDKNEMRWLLGLYFALILVALVDSHSNGWLSQYFFIRISHANSNFGYALAGILALTYYYKHVLVKESTHLHELKMQLSEQIETVQRQNETVKQQQAQLQEANAHLEDQIERHTESIKRHDQSITNYIRLTTESLDEPLHHILKNAEHLTADNNLQGLLKNSIAELNGVISHLKKNLKQS